ncbi:Mrp/NBP35 family ATP-binding protein [Candidatus Bathyarchaeota archaeon]|nr:Mrp/NBP35 family ATP-binding protein [Candidatus Bathyarchaeota archaeon]MBL7080582.1 Mrp/NBP35 family ATP-binding protein [Candidatus Bathyarchaeota archaeon]
MGEKSGSVSTTDVPEVSRQPDDEKLRSRMTKIRHKIAVISGKGGVGKSLVTVNLAVALALNGRNGRVGVLDADIHGPCVPKMLGLEGERLQSGPPGVFPAFGPLNIKVVSMAFLLPSVDAPVIWRGPLKMGAIRQFLSDIAWGDLDYLLIDLPPGTGDESLSVLQLLPEMDGVIIVTIPSEVSQDVVKKAVSFARKMGVPILGIVENMSGVVCPHCGEQVDVFGSGGGEKVATDMGVTFLGSIPLDPRISKTTDAGAPFIIEEPDSQAAAVFRKIVEKVERKTEG